MLTDLDPEQLIVYGEVALAILLVVFIGGVIYLLVWRGINALHQDQYISEAVRGVLVVILRWTTVILIALMALQQAGVRLTSIWAALSAFVVLIGVGFVAVWSVLSNILCSVLLLVFRPFSIGDKIEIIQTTGAKGLYGKVVNLNMLYTFILEESDGNKGAIVQVPNNMFFQNSIRLWPGRRTKNLEETIFKDDSQSIRQNAAL